MEDASQHAVFTQFAHQLLEQITVARAIYHLQHQSGFNINMILYLLWIAKIQHGRLSKQQIKQLHAQIALWHQRVISELKYTHALVATNHDPIALNLKQMLEEEIAKAFVIEQHMLFETKIKNGLLQRNAQQQLTDACASIGHYCELKNDLLIEDDRDAFVQLLSIAFEGLDQGEIERQIAVIFNRFDPVGSKPAQQVLWGEG